MISWVNFNVAFDLSRGRSELMIYSYTVGIKYSNFELSTADHSPYSFHKNANTVEHKKIFELIEVSTLLVKSKYESFLKNYPQKLALLY